MSRRLRQAWVEADLRRLVEIVQRRLGRVDTVLIVDGKPFPVSKHSEDPDAARGWGAGTYGVGYKLHALIDRMNRLVAWSVHPMNTAECVVAADLVEQARDRFAHDTILLGDASYDSNPLHAAVAAAGARMIAPRRRPDLHLCKNRDHHPNRLAAITFTEHDSTWHHLRRRVRTIIERYFGAMASFGAGLSALPTWARRHHRASAWIGAKLLINAARIANRA